MNFCSRPIQQTQRAILNKVDRKHVFGASAGIGQFVAVRDAPVPSVRRRFCSKAAAVRRCRSRLGPSLYLPVSLPALRAQVLEPFVGPAATSLGKTKIRTDS